MTSIVATLGIYWLWDAYRTYVGFGPDQSTVHDANAIVITCMDFRLIDDYVRMLNRMGKNNNYDQFIVAGASLGYNQDQYAHWVKTMDDHIKLSKKLHHSDTIILIDHMDCGAYRVFYGKDLTPEKERQLHIDNLKKAQRALMAHYNDMKVKGYIMDIEGNIIYSL